LPYKVSLNMFADIIGTADFRWFLGGRPREMWGDLPAVKHASPALGVPQGSLPTSVDWTAVGAVTPVKNQCACGSCWAFGVIGVVESAWKLASDQLVSLSEQQILDCNDNYAGNCANGGYMSRALDFLRGVDICTMISYPYRGSEGSCRSTSCDVGMPAGTLQGFQWVFGEYHLQGVLAGQPVGAGIEASGSAFDLYSSGVLTGTCGSNQDHYVTLVGYGTEGGNAYWKLKNSWGSRWGDNGYARILRGINQCGVGQDLTYPLVKAEACFDAPSDWTSSDDYTCENYLKNNYCTADGGEGSGWMWRGTTGSISDYADSNGRSALDACCACGGGSAGVKAEVVV